MNKKCKILYYIFNKNKSRRTKFIVVQLPLAYIQSELLGEKSINAKWDFKTFDCIETINWYLLTFGKTKRIFSIIKA